MKNISQVSAQPTYTMDDRNRVRELVELHDWDGLMELLQAYRPAFQAYARKRLRRQEAEDAVQDAFVKALNGFRDGKFDVSMRLSPWFYAVLSNTITDFVRKNHRHAKMASLDMMRSDEDEDPAFLSILGRDMDPAVPLMKVEAANELHGAVGRLCDEHRVVVQLILFEGKKYKDAAACAGIPVGTAKSRIFQAKETLRVDLAPEEEAA